MKLKSYIKLRDGNIGHNGVPISSLRNGKELWSLPESHYGKFCIVEKEDRSAARHNKKVAVKVVTDKEMKILRSLMI